ncbi:GIY-YIG nuclease family protein [Microvirga ossetica]|uniref:GIY-YIG nuclease family protein n=1 Tax=Microvirga ossetica TaxID=1882682 RepID=UPI003AAAE0F6
MTASSLDSRCHFNHSHSGFSTFRQSLGAILEQTLDLNARPRSSGLSLSNTQNFRFDEACEARLTEWMRDNLRYAHVALTERVEAEEADLIRSLEPPLNLTGWKNPQKPLIQELRRTCVREARGQATDALS